MFVYETRDGQMELMGSVRKKETQIIFYYKSETKLSVLAPNYDIFK
jgi:hypothetical protein